MQEDIFKFLEYKTLYYDKIDFSIVQNAWDILKQNIKIPYVIHIVGTNGKGTTGRFLASYLSQKGFDTLHYSSPHIKKFNERIWINQKDVNDTKLQDAHKKLCEYLNKQLLEKLTYFEYTTLLALYLSSNRDYLILEAGLGGEFDATNVVQNDLSLITTIGVDHQSFLGDTIEKIALTKMRSCDKNMIVGYQTNSEVKNIAKSLQTKKRKIYFIDDFDIPVYTNENLPNYLINNLKLVLSALRFLNISIDTKLFDNIKMPGRFEKIRNNIIVDVGHNPLAAKEIVNNFSNNKVILVYNSYEDKQYEEVLNILKPIIKRVEIIKVDDKRIVSTDILMDITKKLGLKTKIFQDIDFNESYLVFGSFLVVEQFLKKIDEK
jgi:dihydrofolate synthase/folylpolyglutamate synthase